MNELKSIKLNSFFSIHLFLFVLFISFLAETLNAIRTITALNAQPAVIAKYRQFIVEAMNAGIVKSFKVGFGNGLTFCISFFTYGLGFW